MRIKHLLSGHPLLLLVLLSVSIHYSNVVSADSVVFDADAQLAGECPTQASTFITYNTSSTEETVSVLLKPTDESGKLCVLFRKNVDSNEKEAYIPVGRSYDGYDWEASAGEEASLDYLCGVHDNLFGPDRFCQVRLPIYTSDDYYLVAFEHSLPPRDEVARFLERTTFGPTKTEIDSFGAPSFVNFANYVHDQIYNVTLSSHRAYFRKRGSPKSTETYKQSESGPAPCEKFSRWRRYAFTQLDAFYSQEDPTLTFPPPEHTIDIQTVVNGSDTGYVLRYAGHVRTVLTEPFKLRDDPSTVLNMQNASYKLLRADEIQGSARAFPDQFELEYNDEPALIEGGPPSVNLDLRFINTSSLHILDLSHLNSTQLNDYGGGITDGGNLLLTEAIDDPVCATLPNPYDNDSRNQGESSRFNPDPPVFALLPDGTYAIHDKRFILRGNTLEKPLNDGGGFVTKRSVLDKTNFYVEPSPNVNRESLLRGGEQITYCANSASTFVNEKNCVLSYDENACIRPSNQMGSFRAAFGYYDTFVKVDLDNEALDSFYGLTGRHLYAINNLGYDETNTNSSAITEVMYPCAADARSRWIRVSDEECNNATTIHGDTTEAFSFALRTSNEVNPILRDVVMWNSTGTTSRQCHATDAQAVGMTVRVAEDAECWRNVHPDHLSVYDLTSYATSPNGSPVPVDQIVASGTISFIDSMNVWEDWVRVGSNINRYIGRLGDTFDASDLVKSTRLFAEIRDATDSSNARQVNDDAVVAVASALGEIELQSFRRRNRGGGVLVCGSPYEVEPDPFLDDHFEVDDPRSRSVLGLYGQQKRTVWLNIILENTDQLRQRMAWALSKIINVAIKIIKDANNSEANIYLYDTFVRHAFGNFRDLLKEISLNPKMGEMLTFIKSKSVRFNWDVKSVLNFPDENFAREVMQLYTIGLHKLNLDGTPKLDIHGEKQPTYDNKDILTFARAWTGFFYSLRRGNTEDLDHVKNSRIDPMSMIVGQHDFFPKTNLYDGWIGDRYPLCKDLPDKAFLRKGAKYKLLGGTSNPTLQFEDIKFDANAEAKKVVLEEGSYLYAALCKPSIDGECNPEPFVTLEQNYHGQCLGAELAECHVDTLRVVQVKPGLFYEYVQVPCVRYTFYENAKKVISEGIKYDMCADPLLPVATRNCCNINDGNRNHGTIFRGAEYHDERVTYSSNQESCESLGGFICDPRRISWCDSFCETVIRVNDNSPEENVWHWTNNGCSLQLKVRNDGFSAIVHNPNDTQDTQTTIPYVNVDNTVNYINIPWQTDPVTLKMVYPTKENDCGNYSCTLLSDDTCLCDTTMREDVVFGEMPTRNEALKRLNIGFYEPTMYDSGYWEERSNNTDEVALYVRFGSAEDFSAQSVFRTTNEQGKTIYLRNVESIVTVGGKYDIRNPVNFVDLVDIELRDVHYEIDAVFDHLVYHENTPPYISKQLIQHFGISNPSPRFVQAVATAFQRGSFEWSDGANNGTIGDGEWGNLAATAAAIILDPESLSVVLDADPTHGSLREPILKVVGFMRSMEYTPTAQDRLVYPKLIQMQNKIGQMVYESPDQFSFFRPDYTPPGAFSKAALVAPEAQVLTMAYTVGIINGLFSLCRNGLNAWDSGFGKNMWRGSFTDNFAENYTNSVGYLSYNPSSNLSADDVIDELSTLLTSGRLGTESRQYIKGIYDEWNNDGKPGIAKIFAQQLIATTPEFHGTNILNQTGLVRAVTEKSPPANVTYKAVVYLHLFGGLDSFNVLAPYNESCSLYDDYRDERGAVGLETSEMLSIDASGSNQSCAIFGVNDKLPALRDIYNEGKGVFIANIGHLSKPVTKNNYATETNTDLFSHNTMEEEAYAVDAFKEKSGTGVLGRMLDKLEENGLSVGPISIDAKLAMLAGDPRTGRTIDVIPRNGPQLMTHRDFETNNNKRQTMVSHMENLNKRTELTSGFFGDYWSQNLIDVMNKSQDLNDGIKSVNDPWSGGSGVESQLKMVAKLIMANEQRGVNRDAFVVRMGGFDQHSNLKAELNPLLQQIDTAIQKFKDALNTTGLLDNVVFVLGSEFGRTITPNTDAGTDHAWGGNVFMFGGQVEGKRIIGKYPESFKDSDPTNIGRGRLVPSTSWDALWYGISLWFGIEQGGDMEYVLPNSVNFGCNLFTDQDLFVDRTNSVLGCGGEEYIFDVGLFIDSPRYLTGKEQKQLCALALQGFNGTDAFSRCVIVDTQIILVTDASESRRLTEGRKSYVMTGKGKLITPRGSTIAPGQVKKAVQTAADKSAQKFINASGKTIEVNLPNAPFSGSTEKNSTGSSGYNLPDDPYVVEFVNSSLAFNGSTSMIELQAVSGTIGTTSLTLWAVDKNETFCRNADGSNEAENVLPLPNTEVIQNGTSSELLAYDIELNLTGVESSNIFFNTTETAGEIKFCARLDKYVDLFNGSVSFAETFLTIAVNMTTGFELIVDDVERKSPIEEGTNVTFTVNSCICDDSFYCIAPVLEQNSAFNLCLFAENDGLQVESINNVGMFQDKEKKFSPIDDGVANSLSSIEFSPNNTVTMMKTRVIAVFFEAANPSDIDIVGNVNLGFVSTSRRILQETFGTELEGTDAPRASFELSVGLNPLSNIQDSSTTDEHEMGKASKNEEEKEDNTVTENNTGSGLQVNVIVTVVVGAICSILVVGLFHYCRRPVSTVLVK